MENRKKLQIPHTMVILASVALIMAILSYFIPAGEYNRVTNATGTSVIDPDSFHYVEPSPVSLMGFLTSIPRGFIAAASIISMTIFSGAGFGVLRKTGAVDVGIEALATRFEGKGIRIIPILFLIFATIDAFIGMPELCMVYIPIVMPLILRLGFDSITATGVVLLGSAAGFTAAFTNPFTIAVSQKLCELPLYSGWQFRIAVFAVVVAVGILYIMRYASKVLKDPTVSSVYQDDLAKKAQLLSKHAKAISQNPRLKFVGIYVVVIFIIMLYGVIARGWDMMEMNAIFMCIGIGSGLIAGLSSREICVAMIDGAKDVLGGAIFICIARATSVVMSDGKIVDTIVYGLAKLLTSLPVSITIVGLLFIVTALNFFITSGSGKAVILFPILTPLADVCGITRQTAVLAYQFGDGFTNNFWPTGGNMMACLGIAGVPWNKWAKFYLPLLLIWYTVAIVFIVIAQVIQLGPF